MKEDKTKKKPSVRLRKSDRKMKSSSKDRRSWKVKFVDDSESDSKGGVMEISYTMIKNFSALLMSQKEIAYALGIAPETFTRMKNRDEETKRLVTQAINEGRQEQKQTLTKTLLSIAIQGELDRDRINAIKYLKSVYFGLHEGKEIKVDQTDNKTYTVEYVNVGHRDDQNDDE